MRSWVKTGTTPRDVARDKSRMSGLPRRKRPGGPEFSVHRNLRLIGDPQPSLQFGLELIRERLRRSAGG